MHPDHGDLRKRAKEKADENMAFRRFLKFYDEMSDEQLDALVSEITDRVWATIDCTECGACCRQLKPVLSEKDQNRLPKRLDMTVEQLRKQYLECDDSDDEPAWRMKHAPCPFLQEKECTVYEDRPENCRDYPYLYKPHFSYRTLGMIERTETCPVVFRVMEALKKYLDFT